MKQLKKLLSLVLMCALAMGLGVPAMAAAEDTGFSDVAAYQAMEQAVSEGKLRSIGLSNYYTAEDFDRLVNATTITPALLQNETHPITRVPP